MDGRPRKPRSREREFWLAVRAGLSYADAGAAVGVSGQTARRWVVEGGGMPMIELTPPSGRYLSFAEREQIALGLAAGLTQAEIAGRIGRPACTVSREIARNRCGDRPGRYLASTAQARADRVARRPKPAKLALNPRLRRRVEAGLGQRWSPRQIAAGLRKQFGDDMSMRVSHETIYQSLYVQGRGALRRELAACLRTGRAIRRPQRRPDQRRTRIPNMVLISERPAEADDRAVPGHWEGDLIIGQDNKSAIGTLVERTTRYVLLLHLPNGYGAEQVHHAMLAAIKTLPRHLWRSLTWDQGIEMAQHQAITIATGLPIYFCDPAKPWQRGSNENTNGLLRQYFPKGTDLTIHNARHLNKVAIELNSRPRETLNWQTPAEALNELLSNPYPVATTP
jgi:transposase, IS30 family